MMKMNKRNMIVKVLAGTLLTGLLALSSGCVSEETILEPEHAPKISIVKCGNRVSISWPSEVGYRYGLFAYTTDEKIIRCDKSFVGTGDIIEFSFPWTSDRPLPEYNLVFERIIE